MKSSIYILIASLIITSCAPKFQELNDQGFGGGFSTTKSQYSSNKNPQTMNQKLETTASQNESVSVTFQEIDQLKKSNEKLPSVIRIKSTQGKKALNSNETSIGKISSPQNTQHLSIKNKLKSIFSPSKNTIHNSKSSRPIIPNQDASSLRWLLFVLGIILGFISILIIGAGTSDPMFGGLIIGLGVLWFNYSLVLLFGSAVVDYLDEYTDGFRKAVLWSLWSPFLLFIPAIISIPAWMISAFNPQNRH